MLPVYVGSVKDRFCVFLYLPLTCRRCLHFSSGEGTESACSSGNKVLLDDSTQEARWEKQLSELARVEGLVQKRKAELQRMDAVLIERRHELEDVVHKVLSVLCFSM